VRDARRELIDRLLAIDQGVEAFGRISGNRDGDGHGGR
jgi:hypothetical protein